MEFCDKFNQLAVLLESYLNNGERSTRMSYITMINENGDIASTILFRNIKTEFLPNDLVTGSNFIYERPISLMYEQSTN